jgi:hypothetical protein
MRGIAALVVGLSSVVCLLGQTGQSGLQVVVKVEPHRVAGQNATEQTARIIETQFPDGSAELELITDGQAVRATLSGGMLGFADGTVRLVPRGSSSRYVINPAARTYRLDKPANLEGQKPEFSVKSTGVYKSILGYRAQRVTASYRQIVKTPMAGPDGKNAMEVRVEFENWCTSALKVPRAMADMMNVAHRVADSADVRYSQACPLSLESVMKMSILPGFEIVSTTRSIRRLSKFPPGVFELPNTYRELPGGPPPR